MIIVIGASKGIGLTVAQFLSEKGEEVMGVSRSVSNGEFECKIADVTNFTSLKKISDDLRKENKRITSLVNLAGVASMNMALMANPETSERLIKTNFLGTVFSNQAFAPLLIRNGGGSIINFSSIAAEVNLEGEAVYAATKAAVENYSRTLAKELAKFNIRVNVISPGPINTDLLKGLTKEQISKVLDKQIIKTQFTKRDVSDLVWMLLQDSAKSLTGQILHVGGVS